MLYTSLVCLIQEFAPFIWDPHQQPNIEQLNCIQNQFISFSEYCFGNKLNLKSLTDRRRFNHMAFIFKLLNTSIDYPDILLLLPIAIPSFNSRQCLKFKNSFH